MHEGLIEKAHRFGGRGGLRVHGRASSAVVRVLEEMKITISALAQVKALRGEARRKLTLADFPPYDGAECWL